MTDQEILEGAIVKARIIGWNVFGLKVIDGILQSIATNWITESYSVSDILFSQDFAKMLFGSKEVGELCGDDRGEQYCERGCQLTIRAWQFHIKQLAVTPDDERLKYIERFL